MKVSQMLTGSQKTKSFSILMILAIAIGVGVWLNMSVVAGPEVSDKPVESEKANRPLPVNIMTVKYESNYQTPHRYTGLIEAKQTSTLSFKRSDRLNSMHVEEGQLVSKGQVIAKLDVRDLETHRHQLISQYKQAAATALQLGATSNRHNLKLEKLKELYAEQAASKDELDVAQYTSDAASAAVVAQKAFADSITSQLDQLEIDLEESVLKSPYAGCVGKFFVDAGSMVSPNIGIVELVEVDQLEAWVGVSPGSLQKFKVGSKYTISIGEQKMSATFKAVMPQLDRDTRTVQIVLQLSPATKNIVPGQVVMLHLDHSVSRKGVWVPIDALARSDHGLWSVYVAEDGVLKRSEVEVLYTEASRVYVRGSIVDGDLIVSGGVHRIVAGQKVETINK